MSSVFIWSNSFENRTNIFFDKTIIICGCKIGPHCCYLLQDSKQINKINWKVFLWHSRFYEKWNQNKISSECNHTFIQTRSISYKISMFTNYLKFQKVVLMTNFRILFDRLMKVFTLCIKYFQYIVTKHRT